MDFGGLYPNPAVLGAALAMVTQNVEIRAGSVVVPLHHPIRLVEEWSVVDNLAGGRVALSLASGWHPHDFVLASVAYDKRKEYLFETVQTIRDLWSGKRVRFQAAEGDEYQLRTLPRPIREDLPIWISIAGNPETWIRAGEIGANVLTGLSAQPLKELGNRIRDYHQALEKHGHDTSGKTITVMLHTFVGESNERIKSLVRQPIQEYLKTFLQQKEALIGTHSNFEVYNIGTKDKQDLLEITFDRYFERTALFGTAEKCSRLVDQLCQIGVNEIACLVDFGLSANTVLSGLNHLNDLKQRYGA